jgi:integrase
MTEPTLEDFTPNTVAWLIQKRIDESRTPGARKMGSSQGYVLRGLQRDKIIAGKLNTALKPIDFIECCRAYRAKGLLPQTINQRMSFLAGVLKHAAEIWDMPDTGIVAYQKSKPQLKKEQLIGKSPGRTRRPTQDELDRLLAYFDERKRMTIPMRAIVEFSVLSARRISETCRLRWEDIDEKKRTCMVRDLKNPAGKGFDDEFPLLGRAWEIVQAQPRTCDRIFPYNAKSCSLAYTRAKQALSINGLRLHDNRREAISRLFEQGFNVPEAQKLSLHRNATVLLKNYTSLKPEDLHRGPAAKRHAHG